MARKTVVIPIDSEPAQEPETTSEAPETPEASVADPGKTISEAFPGDNGDDSTPEEDLSELYVSDDEDEPDAEVATEEVVADEADKPEDVAVESEAVTSPEVPSPTHNLIAEDTELLSIAYQAGFSPEQAMSYGTPERLTQAIDDRLRAYLPPPDPIAGVKFDLKLDKEELSPELVDQLEAMNVHYANMIAQSNQAYDHLVRQRAQDAQRAEVRQFEDRVLSLPEEYRDIFGDKPLAKLTDKAPEYGNWVKLAGEIDLLESGYAARGGNIPPKQAIFEKALKSVFGDAIAQKKTVKTVASVQKRKEQTIARPTQRNGRPLSGRDAAMAYATQFYEERGLMNPNDDEADSLL